MGGFSLIELLCVIAIIAILVALLLGPVLRALGRAKRLKEDLRSSHPAGIVTKPWLGFAGNRPSGANHLEVISLRERNRDRQLGV